MPIITSAGALPTSPTDLRDQIVAEATLLSPGLTADLPGSLIEDMASTAAGAVVIQDQAAVDLLNSISPVTANPFIMKGLGQVYGVAPGIGSNTSVLVQFSAPGSPGYIVEPGFIVSDGSHQYIVRDPAILNGSGVSPAVFCLAVDPGSWAVPSGTVTTLASSVPDSVALTCTNPAAGTPGASAQTDAEYRAQVIQAGQAIATGVPTFVRTTLGKVDGVQERLISFRQTGGGWQVLVGGGDPYEVANAIFQSLFDINDLQGASGAGSTQTISIVDYPDTYLITYVIPAQALVDVQTAWDTVAGSNFVSPTIVSAQVQPAMVSYVNSIAVGKPLSLLQLQDVFIAAVAATIPESEILSLTFIVKINGTIVTPSTGTVLIFGDPEAYFFTEASRIIVNQA
jgi:hypothetical protein